MSRMPADVYWLWIDVRVAESREYHSWTWSAGPEVKRKDRMLEGYVDQKLVGRQIFTAGSQCVVSLNVRI